MVLLVQSDVTNNQKITSALLSPVRTFDMQFLLKPKYIQLSFLE